MKTDETYKETGMSCGGCVKSVTSVVSGLSPRLEVEVSLEEGTMRVRGEHDPDAVKDAVEAAGFDVAPLTAA